MPSSRKRLPDYLSGKWARLRELMKSPEFRRNVVLYAFSSLMLVVWNDWGYVKEICAEVNDQVQHKAPCVNSGIPPAEVSVSWLYSPLLSWISRPTHKDVAALYIDSGLSQIQLNTCLARSYLADVLTLAATQHPARLVVDKYFGPDTCTEGEDSVASDSLVKTVQALPFPVIIGRSTQRSAEAKIEPCLVQQPELSFHSTNVIPGLVRPNSDLVKIPLQWLVSESPGQAPQFQDTLAFAALRSFAPELVKGLLRSHRQPYAKIQDDIPEESSAQFLCSGADSAVKVRWHLQCSSKPDGDLYSLQGKVVVVGAQSSNDQEDVLGHTYYGYQLQAQYLDDLLTGSYLLASPGWLPVTIYLFFVLISEAPRFIQKPFNDFTENHLFPRTIVHEHLKLFWSLAWAVVFILGSNFLFFLFHFLPPLGLIVFIFSTVFAQVFAGIQSEAGKRLHS